MLTDRFGVFEALAHSTIKLNRCTSADELSMEPQVAEAAARIIWTSPLCTIFFGCKLRQPRSPPLSSERRCR
jgi:crotonobetainyl-CoA:carnitine CoA-transferase CaiB-like acyl-CoA transferase